MVSRRQLLLGAAGLAGGSALAGGGGAIAAEAYKRGFAEAEAAGQIRVAKATLPWSGKHQGGVEAPAQAHANFVALDLKSGITRDDMLRWMLLLTEDIAALATGEAVLADPTPELILGAANLTVTVGFGPSLFKKLSLEGKMPIGFAEIPSFKIDQLRDEFTGGDVLLQIGADDLQILAHATRALLRDSESFGNVRWIQAGFTNAVGTNRPGTTQRNLMGQVDGTDNPDLGSENFANQVWIDNGPAWAVGGTQVVLRRIKMNLNTWDTLGRPQKEQTIGRYLHNGAPLNGKEERDPIDFEAENENGLKVIPEFAHIRRASAKNMDELFFRRPFNYQEVSTDAGARSGELESGLLWTAYAKDLSRQYVPVQERLAQFDLLNQWTTPVGSATFAIARGVKPGEILAEELFA
jgi:dye decolorizing peroxidase